MVKVDNIVFEYTGKRALKGVSFTVAKGSVVALVGPNGAGKTTLIRCIAGLSQPFSGSITVNDIDVLKHPRSAHRHIGYLSDFFGLYPHLTVRQCLSFAVGIHQVPLENQEEKIMLAAERLDLVDYLDKETRTLSRGLKQRAGIAQALVHDPEILLLDEPASGLDPEARFNLSQLFLDLKKTGITLIVSSHILAELEDYCTEMLLIKDGEILKHCDAQEKPSTDSPQGKPLEIILCEPAEKYLDTFSSMAGISAVSVKENRVQCLFSGDEKGLHELLKAMIEKKVPIYHFAAQERKLQDIYMDQATHLKEQK